MLGKVFNFVFSPLIAKRRRPREEVEACFYHRKSSAKISLNPC